MKHKTRCTLELFLYNFLWTGDLLCRPSYRHLGESFEGWAYRRGLLARIRRLEAGKYLDRNEDQHPGAKVSERVLRITCLGRLRALGGRDPEGRWGRKWDGLWRTVAFDLPETERVARQRLRRLLRRLGFGRIQRSVWVTPDRIDPLLEELNRQGSNPQSLLTWEVHPPALGMEASMVRSAWKFDAIHEGYTAYLKKLESCPLSGSLEALRCWLGEERTAWMRVISADPLLPQELLPEGYLGRAAWEQRGQVMERFRASLLRMGER